MSRIIDEALALYGKALDGLKSRNPLIPASDQRPNYKFVLVGIAAKANEELKAVDVLSRAGLGTQALTLARTIFEMAVAAEYIGQDPVPRAERYLNYEFIMMKHFLDRVREHYPGKVREHITAEQEKMTEGEYAKVKGQFRDEYHWAGPRMTIYALAKSISAKFFYDFIYAFLSDDAHTSVTSLKRYIEESAEGVRLKQNPALNGEDHAVNMAVLFALGILEDLSKEYAQGLETKIGEFRLRAFPPKWS